MLGPRPGRARLLPLLGLALLIAQLARYWPYVNDDAYITLRYSQALALGRGPWFNAGEHVEGYTNASWMLLMAGLWPLVGATALPLVAKALGAAAQLLAVGLAARLAAAEGEGEEAAAALRALAVIGLAAATPGLALNAVSGLETGLFSLLLTAGALRVGRESAGAPGAWGALLLALSGLTRPEGMALAAIGLAVKAGGLGLDAARGRRGWRAVGRAIGLDALVLALIFGGTFALRAALYDGEWLPNTWYAKQGGLAGVAPLDYLWGGLRGPLLGLPGILLLLPGLVLLLRARRALRAPAAVAIFGALVPLLTGADWMPGHRMTAPYLPLLLALAVLSWGRPLAARLPARTAALLTLAATPLSAALQQAEGVDLHAEITLRAEGYRTGHEALAAWLHERAAPGDTVALMDIGIIGYRNPDLQILDLSGLTDRFIAKSPGLFLDKTYDPAYVLDRAPRFVVITLWAEGESYVKPPPGTEIRPWTRTEQTLLEDPRFAAGWRREGAMERSGRWTDGVAARLGAVTVFEHAHPGVHYLLVVFERAPAAG